MQNIKIITLSFVKRKFHVNENISINSSGFSDYLLPKAKTFEVKF